MSQSLPIPSDSCDNLLQLIPALEVSGDNHVEEKSKCSTSESELKPESNQFLANKPEEHAAELDECTIQLYKTGRELADKVFKDPHMVRIFAGDDVVDRDQAQRNLEEYLLQLPENVRPYFRLPPTEYDEMQELVRQMNAAKMIKNYGDNHVEQSKYCSEMELKPDSNQFLANKPEEHAAELDECTIQLYKTGRELADKVFKDPHMVRIFAGDDVVDRDQAQRNLEEYLLQLPENVRPYFRLPPTEYDEMQELVRQMNAAKMIKNYGDNHVEQSKYCSEMELKPESNQFLANKPGEHVADRPECICLVDGNSSGSIVSQ